MTNVEKHYFGEATSNRIKRELRELYSFEREGIELENPYYMSAALIIPVRIAKESRLPARKGT